jgi:preprotein translocase subunit SecF
MSRRLRRLHRRNLVKKKPSSHHEEAVEVAHEENTSTSKFGGLVDFYDKNYKSLLIIPILLLILSLSFLGYNFFSTGSFVDVGVSIKGGISVTALGEIEKSLLEIEDYIQTQFPSSDVSARELSNAGETVGVTLEVSEVSQAEFLPVVREYLGQDLEYSAEETGSALGQSFFRQMMVALGLAFVLMGVVVFISFRTVVPSLAVILSAASDMIITLAVISLLNVKLSLAGIAAFLMLIGYSVDTDILLTTRVLKRKRGTVIERVLSALETGMTMNITTLAAISIGLIFSTSDVLRQIMLILFIGLIVDMINTWIQNVGILRLYVDSKSEEKKD